MRFKFFSYELIVQQKKRSPLKYSRRPWTESETNTLLRLRNEGKNWVEVGKLLNRTHSACASRYAKIHKGVIAGVIDE